MSRHARGLRGRTDGRTDGRAAVGRGRHGRQTAWRSATWRQYGRGRGSRRAAKPQAKPQSSVARLWLVCFTSQCCAHFCLQTLHPHQSHKKI